MIIKSRDNKKLKQFRLLQKRKYRDAYGLVPLEGALLLEDVFLSGADIAWILYSPKFKVSHLGIEILKKAAAKDIPCYLTAENLLKEISAVKTFQGLLCVARMPVFTLEEIIKEKARLLILDKIQDPGNLGSLLRTALAGGITGVICAKGTVDIWSPKVLRSTMGAAFRMPIVREQQMEDIFLPLKNKGIPLYSCDPAAAVSCFEVKFPASYGLVIGNESKGISANFKGESCQQVKIPLLNSVQSLNAAAAGAIIIYEALRQNKIDGEVVF